MPFQFTCDRCGVMFFRGERATASRPHRFCSRSCADAPRPGIPVSDGTILIPLTQDAFAIIDGDDADLVLPFNWHLTDGGYAARNIGARDGGGHEYMHRRIAKTPVGAETDHINGNRTDNRKRNLRTATRSQNNVNRPVAKRNRSGYRGVSLGRARGVWVAHITVNGKSYRIGQFPSPESAARAYDVCARIAFGEFAQPNFPAEE